MDDDRKQRFRFHKEDEILLLNIVLRASPCPYNISTRDGAIMVAWNNIAEEFKSLCKPRPDGKVPHSRTCRTRCDKMITDYLSMQASPQLRGKKLESKDDRIKNELVARLSALQGKGLDPNLIAVAAEAGAGAGSGAGTGAGTGAGAGSDSPSNSDDPISNLSPAISSASGIPGSSELMTHVTSSGSGSSLMTPGQVLGRASGNQGMNDSPLLSHTSHLQQHHHQPHHQQHHQQQDHYQQHHHQQLSSQQAASELLAASALLLPSTMGGMHSSTHQNSIPTSASTSIFATPNSTAGTVKVDKKGKQVVGARKRRVNNTSTAEVQAQQQSAPVSTASFEALQRQNLSHSTANTNASQTSVLPSTKRLRSSAKQATTATTATTTMPTYTQQQSQQQQQQVNGGRTMMGVLGHGVGSGFTSNDLTGISGLSNNSHSHGFPDIHSVHDFGDDNDDDDDDQNDHNNIDDDDDDDDDDGGDTGFQDTQDAFDNTYDNNNFEHDLDGVSPASQLEASTLLSFQKGTSGSNGGNGSGGYRKNKNSKQMMMSDNNGQSSKPSSMRNKGSNNGGGGQQRHGNNNNSNNNAGLGFGAGAGGNGGGGSGGGGFGGMSMISTGFGAAGGFLQLSQLNADDRAYLMRLVALEEQRVKIEVDKVALERERLALENRRLEWKMQQMNHQ
ncbi:MAG: hypothetical protein JOS17DRAFT_787890 [Linnemannia elongata]|nr:MAG: hypothetical protein JOS17DRAFT_787890 [Linnemannia elongata]